MERVVVESGAPSALSAPALRHAVHEQATSTLEDATGDFHVIHRFEIG